MFFLCNREFYDYAAYSDWVRVYKVGEGEGGRSRGKHNREGGLEVVWRPQYGSWRMVFKQRFSIGYHCSTRHPIVQDNRLNLCIGGGPRPGGIASSLGKGGAETIFWAGVVVVHQNLKCLINFYYFELFWKIQNVCVQVQCESL